MNVLLVSGIWPPDVGGPASHAPDVAAFLHGRGHHVEVLTTASAPPEPQAYPVHWISRAIPKGAIHVRTGLEVARLARAADVVYTTGMYTRCALACRIVRVPYVLKLTGDPAFERSRWRGHVAADVVSFQGGGGGAEGRALRVIRDWTVRGAAHVLCPSAFLCDLAISWGVRRDRVTVVPNAIPLVPPSTQVDAGPSQGLLLAFAGRIGPQKALGVLLDAVRDNPGVRLVVAGDGDDRARLEADAPDNAEFVGPLPREGVLELFRRADAMVLSSSWENFPHAVVEALASGTPVIATRVGGVSEVIVDGENGLLVPPDDSAALRCAIERFRDDIVLRQRLAAGASPSVQRYAPGAVYGEVERILHSVAR